MISYTSEFFTSTPYQLTAIVYDKTIINYTKVVIIQTLSISLNDTHVVIVSLAVCVLLRSSPRHHVIIILVVCVILRIIRYTVVSYFYYSITSICRTLRHIGICGYGDHACFLPSITPSVCISCRAARWPPTARFEQKSLKSSSLNCAIPPEMIACPFVDFEHGAS